MRRKSQKSVNAGKTPFLVRLGIVFTLSVLVCSVESYPRPTWVTHLQKPGVNNALPSPKSHFLTKKNRLILVHWNKFQESVDPSAPRFTYFRLPLCSFLSSHSLYILSLRKGDIRYCSLLQVFYPLLSSRVSGLSLVVEQ